MTSNDRIANGAQTDHGTPSMVPAQVSGRVTILGDSADHTEGLCLSCMIEETMTATLLHTDFRTSKRTTYPIPEGVSIVVADRMPAHEPSDDCDDRRQWCKEAATALGKPFLRDVTMNELEAGKATMDVMAYRTAKHVVEENERVNAALDCLRANDMATLGLLLSESHLSGRRDFERTCPELDQLVEIGSSLPGFIGAGTGTGERGDVSIHWVESGEVETYRRRLSTAFETMNDNTLRTVICNLGEGAELYV